MKKTFWCHHYEYLPFVQEDLSKECGYCIENKKIKKLSMKYQVLVKIKQGEKYVWLPVSPTNGEPYQFTKEEAEKYIETYTFHNRPYLGETMKLKEIIN